MKKKEKIRKKKIKKKGMGMTENDKSLVIQNKN
jgi:hypothetical protein